MRFQSITRSYITSGNYYSPVEKFINTDKFAMRTKYISQYKIGNRIAYLRRLRGYSQKQLAELSDMTQSMLSQVEANSKELSLSSLISIAHALDTHPGILLAEDHVHIFDIKRIKRKYKKKSDLNDTLFRACSEVFDLLKELGFK